MKRILTLVLTCLISFACMNPSFLVHAEDELSIYSDYYLLLDRDNGQVIMEHGSDDQIYPASLTKIMTLLIGVENISEPSEIIILDSEIFKGLYEENASMAGFYLDEKVTLEDCLYGLFLPSGAETTRAIATKVAGSEDEFVVLMNKKAQELGMEHTHYVNTTGLHDIEHYTTLNDLAILLEYSLQNETFKSIFMTREYTAYSGSMHPYGVEWKSTTFSAVNRVGWQDLDENTILGGKTGYTIPAGLCLATVASYDNRNLMLITAYAPVGGTSYHAIDAVNMYSEVYHNYTKHELYNEMDLMGEIPLNYKLFQESVGYYPSGIIDLTLANDINVEEIEVISDLVDFVDAPVMVGQKLGEINLVYHDEVLETFEVVAQEDIQRTAVLYYSHVVWEWVNNHIVYTGIIFFIIGFIIWRIYVNRFDIILENSRRKKRKRRSFKR